ncbi:MAG: NAD(P)/FAD-dependent oxidoreductase [Tissierellia bacterium]|nr:NAD(P)/FAD-dependent oxidoreductase [Tissierellia bacterium]
MNKYQTIVIGAGASGLFFSSLCKQSDQVLIIEKNPYPGKKLNITGKGRCNITNYSSPRNVLDNIFANKKFMYSSIYTLPPEKTVEYFHNLGLDTKTERGNRVFPISDKAKDVSKTLFKHACATFNFDEIVLSVKKENTFKIRTNKQEYQSKNLVIATGGKSYPLTGSTGDGYKFAESFHHSITPLYPALVGFYLKSDHLKNLAGLSLRNVSGKLMSEDGRVFNEEFGEMLFTHKGISGPAILRLSAFYSSQARKLSIDLKPALSMEMLETRIQRDFDRNGTKFIKNVLHELMPTSLIGIVLSQSEINETSTIHTITKQERNRLAYTIKNLQFSIDALGDFSEAVITNGGVDVTEINPKTMESKFVDGLYFIGEVLDVAANTGGYNLQIAFSTAYQAYNHIGGKQ